MKNVMVVAIAALFVVCSAVVLVGTASAYDFGSGTGCSPIEDVDATGITTGDVFVGRIGTTGVSGVNKNGKSADNSDSDGFTDSLEMCINDALYGYCTTLLGDDSAAITVVPLDTAGRNNNKQYFEVTFNSVTCAITECSDREDNDCDGLYDMDDPDCTDYDGTSEGVSVCP
ncbi:hypothetical protein N9903_01270 [bacterium]|nr:hypothetical protein [bacterium]